MALNNKMTNILTVNIKPTLKQRDAWQHLHDTTTKFILFGGGAGGGKSWQGCEWCLILAIQFPGIKLFIGRNELKRIMGSTYITWLKVCKHHNIPNDIWKLNSQQSFIEFINFKTKKYDGTGSRIDLIDVARKPSDPLYERFGSMEFTNGWLEEIGEIPEKAFDVLKSRIGRHKVDGYNLPSKMFLTCNPKKNWGYFQFYKLWKEGTLPQDCCFIQSLYKDNPYTADEYEDNLKSIRDPVLKQRLMMGNWEYDDDAGLIFEYEKILNMYDIPLTQENNGEMYITVDVARFGRDKAVIWLWQGLFIKNCWSIDRSSTTYLVEKIRSKMHQHHVSVSNVVIDEDGVGGGVVDMLYGSKGFVNNSRAVEELYEDTQETDRYSYKNLRSQCYFKLAEYVNKGKIGCYLDVPLDIREALTEELEVIRAKDVEKNEKKMQIIAKDEIKDVIGRSPDYADAMMMRMYFELGQQAVSIAIAF